MGKETKSLKEIQIAEKEMRRKLILEATLHLFGQNQINNVSMRDIAKEAGISAALIYRHFKDRDELFMEAFMFKTSEVLATFEQTFLEEKNISIESVGKEFIYYLIHNPLFFKMMTNFMQDHTLVEGNLERFNNTVRELLSIFDIAFEKNGLNQHVRLHSHAFFSALNGIMLSFYQYPGRSEEEIERHIDKLTSLISSLFSNIE